ncbi:MAG TPA: hypothetical protein VGX91_11605 [Candidatus Cybelea sp.]|nr:hypothetical protein [Candidatus Cybelea sp.]
MPLQNRVTPFGALVAVSGRGLMMGNRGGALHDDKRKIVRLSVSKRWIACVLEFRGRKRTVMTPHRYTELFFLDEAAALSAGHRPCFECRRADCNLFRAFWARAIGPATDADSMDLRLHADRLDGKSKRTYRADIATLPDGAYVVFEGEPHLIWGDAIFPWTDSGYRGAIPRPKRGELEVLTPRAFVEVLSAGYRPMVHPSAIGAV